MKHTLPLLVLIWPQPAFAHLVGVELGPFYAGVLHIYSGAEYIAVLLAFGVISALSRKTAAGWGLVAVPAGVLIGGLISLVWVSNLSGVIPVLVVTATLGLLAALAWRLPAPLLPGILALGATALGFSNAQALGDSPLSGGLYISGAALATGATHAILTAVCTRTIEHLKGLALVYRVLGSWLAAFGAITVALSIAR